MKQVARDMKIDRYGLYGMADFPKSEYEGRIKRAQKAMHERRIDGLLITSEENVYYFSGYRTTAGFIKDYAPCVIILPAQGSPRSILSIAMRGNAEAMSSVSDVCYLGWEGLERLTDLRFSTGFVETIIKEIEPEGLGSQTIGVELNQSMRMGVSAKDFESIKSALSKATFVDAGPLIWELRMVKSSLEVQHLKRACDMACKGFQIGFKSLREGMSEREFARAVYIGMLDAGCEDNPVKMTLNTRAGLDRYAWCEARPSERIIKKGDIVILDNGGMLYRGYWADIARFACVGEPSKNQKELCDIAREAQEVGIDNLRPGVPVSQVYAKVMDFIKKSGYERYQMYEDAGHGIGLDIHEPPHFNYRSDVILRPGMVVTMEPTIYDIPVIKGILEGSINPAEGLFFLEDEVLITDSKPEILSPLDRSMHIVST